MSYIELLFQARQKKLKQPHIDIKKYVCLPEEDLDLP